MTEIATEVLGLYDLIKQDLNRDIGSLMTELDKTSQWLARSAELLADAQYEVDVKRGEVAEQYRGETATMLREILSAQCATENRLLNQCERLNAALVHRIDSIRSILSAEKELSKV